MCSQLPFLGTSLNCDGNSQISTVKIDELKDELIHWLQQLDEEKLNESEELLYRTVTTMKQQTKQLPAICKNLVWIFWAGMTCSDDQSDRRMYFSRRRLLVGII